MSDTRRIKFDYEKASLGDIIQWLKVNHISHKFIPGEPGVENLIFFIEIYSAKHETAIRIKWNVL